jgi:opacity protein-like surface antigen
VSISGKTTSALLGALALTGIAIAPAAAQNQQHGTQDRGLYVALNGGVQTGGQFKLKDGDEFEAINNNLAGSIGAVFGYVWPVPRAGGAIETEIQASFTPQTFSDGGGPGHVSWNTIQGLANIWFVFDTNGKVQPYLGGGVGYGSLSNLDDDVEGSLVYQFGGGLRTNLTRNGCVYGGLGYRYIAQTGEADFSPTLDITSNAHKIMFEVGVRLGRR